MVMTTRHDEQGAEEKLAELLIPITPEDWSAFQLEVEIQKAPDGALTMQQRIISPEGYSRPIVMPTDEIISVVKGLYDVFCQGAHAWVGMVMLVYYNGTSWEYRVNYKYE
jgi:hypothetical protein